MNDYKQFFDFLADAILVVNESSEIIFANPSCLKLFGYTQSQMEKLSLEQLMKEDLHGKHPEHVKNYLKSRLPPRHMTSRPTFSCIGSKGEEFMARISISSMTIDGALFGIATLHDFTAVQEEINTLEYNSYIDFLTNLHNLRYLEKAIRPNSRILKSWNKIGILYMDLDKFKPINDEYGHDIGDIILKETATRIKENIRINDLLFRIGGDEFLILLDFSDCTDEKTALDKIGNLIHEAIAKPFTPKNHFIRTGISIGAGTYYKGQADIKTLIKQTDKAMYASKSSGKAVTNVDQLSV